MEQSKIIDTLEMYQTALLNVSAFHLRGYIDILSPLAAMHLLDRSCMIVGKYFEILRSPIVASEPGLCVDVICMSRAHRVVGDNSHTAYQHVIL